MDERSGPAGSPTGVTVVIPLGSQLSLGIRCSGTFGETVRRVVGFGLLAIAALLLVFELLALADPVGTKMADDGDPFGNPYQPWWVHAVWFAIVALLAAVGARLSRRSRRHRP